jgi:adenylate cyclase
MTPPLNFRIYESQQLAFTADSDQAVELGRQSEGEPGPYTWVPAPARRRLVIAPRTERSVSRQHLLVEPQPDGRVRLTNLSGTSPIGLADGLELTPGAAQEATLPIVLSLGTKTVRVQAAVSEEGDLHPLPESTPLPGNESAFRTVLSPLQAAGAAEGAVVVRWLRVAMNVLQSAATSAEFFDHAARALVDLVDLDSGRVLLLHQDGWRPRAVETSARVGPGEPATPSRHVLDRVRRERRTFRELPGANAEAASLRSLEAVVAAPIVDSRGEVIGALYGERRRSSRAATADVPAGGQSGEAARATITEPEAMLVEVLACGVAAGLARLEQEQAALAARVQFEQFFTPELSLHLARQPDLLKGRDAEVTLLFCDIRSFSAVSEKLGPAGTVEWVGSVMAALSECVLAHHGVLVDYIGDELMAMWGAPGDQPDHPRLACQAALDMLGRLPHLNERWQATLGRPTELGIGVNTGIARVGNTGSPYKFKYGPLGNSVNLASRVQGATKYLECRLLVTGATQARLDDTFVTRRLCRVRVVNIAEPVELYELTPPGQPGWPAARTEYEKALALFEQQDFDGAARILTNWRAQQPGDRPALLLLQRAVQRMVEAAEPFDPVWVLPGK